MLIHANYRTQTAFMMLKYSLVFLLLFSFGSSIAFEWHDSSHLAQVDNHCSVCVAFDDYDYPLAFFSPPLFDVSLAGDTTKLIIAQVILPYSKTAGNRDPPAYP
tara:strand:- start:1106 stop:1417 length:312 start_codon:yes stop_codon:yes gene_type:complete